MSDENEDAREKSALERKLAAKIDEWRAEVDRLKAKARGQQADTEMELSREAEKLQRHVDEQEDRLKQLQRTGTEAFDEVRKGAEKAWDDLELAFRRAWDRFR